MENMIDAQQMASNDGRKSRRSWRGKLAEVKGEGSWRVELLQLRLKTTIRAGINRHRSIMLFLI